MYIIDAIRPPATSASAFTSRSRWTAPALVPGAVTGSAFSAPAAELVVSGPVTMAVNYLLAETKATSGLTIRPYSRRGRGVG
jgi:hypothetical protein